MAHDFYILQRNFNLKSGKIESFEAESSKIKYLTMIIKSTQVLLHFCISNARLTGNSIGTFLWTVEKINANESFFLWMNEVSA